ncbi:uncharacterized protein LOC124858265 isoform X2 [Girardinichthys multiradiatus]|uniref:uncharacterized protein LOC124858265 isoform X2 n=1 Tax=Girardinichthys multiradiatus TaxID=208333 RepID=UPI001FAE7511|nr:uncharacterized protein LOC124858265 isoform X2 [Girardinichthys multiradiatus]
MDVWLATCNTERHGVSTLTTEIRLCGKKSVQVGEDDYVHLQIFQSPLLGNTIATTFEGVQGDHKREDPLTPFKPFSYSENTT